jgi:hypothetical protein
MRLFGAIALSVFVCGISGTAQTDERAQKVLTEARAALGGEARLAAVESLSTTGRTRRVQGENLVPIEFEMLVELPDKYIRRDEIPAQESDPTTIGFNGAQLVQVPPPAAPAARPGMPPPPPEMFENLLKQRAVTARQDFARLMLGFFATSYEAYPLTFKYVGQAEAPQGKAHVLEATGEANFKLRFFVDMQTSLPIMVSWSAPARPAGRGAALSASGSAPPASGVAPPTSGVAPPASGAAPPTSATAPPGSASAPPGSASAPPASASAPPASVPEQRLYFSDYRDVDGLKLPFRLRRGVGTNTSEETTFDRFRINPKIDPRRFEVRK